MRPLLGTTFSHRHLRHFRIDASFALKELFSLHFDIVRLGCYWDDLEPEEGRYDFSEMEMLLSRCEKVGQKVVLTVGMKAPRWPEYYFPKWLPEKTPAGARESVLRFMGEAVNRLKRFRNITSWQVENEPLDPSGAKKMTIPESILEEEVALVRSLDDRTIILSAMVQPFVHRRRLRTVISLSDAVGIDLYYKVPLFHRFYSGPIGADERVVSLLKKEQKPFWIMELQAEPWEKKGSVAFSDNPPSLNPDLLRKNVARAKQLQSQAVLLWGFEYWLYKKLHGDPRFWEAASSLKSGRLLH